MKRLLALVPLAALLVSILPAAAAETTPDTIKARGVLRVGVKYDSPPFGVLDPKTNKVVGFDIDIAKAIAKQILGDDSKIEFVQVSSANRIPQLVNGNIDMIVATMTITTARLQQIDFSNVYFRAGQSLLVAKSSPITSYKDLGGKSVCSIAGSTPEQTIRRLVPTANVVLLEGYPECFAALRAGRVDAVTTDNGILAGLRDQDPANYKLVGGLFTAEPYGIGIAKGNTALTDAVNTTLTNIYKSGQYAKLYQQWLHEPLPADTSQYFGISPARAATEFATMGAGGAAAPSPAATK